MRMSKAFMPTLKESPAEAEVVSHKLMIRAGLIRKLGSGAYTYLPLGYRVLKKIIGIITEEMERAGAEELLMPAIQPRELWEKTGRYSLMGDILITYKDRHGKEYVLGPTHEEVITDLASREIRSYRDLPRILYQIQTKFRDEPRPRFGVLRSKEFIMKDAYSFDADENGLNASYKAMYEAYCRIFRRCGLEYVPVEADSGFMGGDVSHEFMVPAPSGEDRIAVCGTCGYSASAEVAGCGEDNSLREKPGHIEEVDTPNVSTVLEVSRFLKVKPARVIKTLIYKTDGTPVAVLLRGDHNLNEVKLARHLGTSGLSMADEALIRGLSGGPVGFSGPVGLKGVKIICDYAIKGMRNAVTGANKRDRHLTGVDPEKDFTVDQWADLRYIEEGDACPKCRKGKILLKTTIEIGHTFKLGTKYSRTLGAKYLDKDGKERLSIMGCYGIGVNRIIASLIEQSHDKDGIIWPEEIAPYRVLILILNMDYPEGVKAAEDIYKSLREKGVEVLLDDRRESAGKKFKDADLIGIPYQIIIGERSLVKGEVELAFRGARAKKEFVDCSKVAERFD